jgi:hypothetical protein
MTICVSPWPCHWAIQSRNAHTPTHRTSTVQCTPMPSAPTLCHRDTIGCTEHPAHAGKRHASTAPTTPGPPNGAQGTHADNPAHLPKPYCGKLRGTTVAASAHHSLIFLSFSAPAKQAIAIQGRARSVREAAQCHGRGSGRWKGGRVSSRVVLTEGQCRKVCQRGCRGACMPCMPIVVIRANLKETTPESLGSLRVVSQLLTNCMITCQP